LPAVDSARADVESVVPERFVRGVARGRLIEAEHLARYWWASRLVKDRRVLDAGCGTGYGASAFAEAGARAVVGVDLDEDVLAEAQPAMHSVVELRRADIRHLPFEDASFDVVVCFETLEHLETPDLALDEFARVLGQDGLLIVSSPNRSVYPPGNPHHHHEYTPDELEGALAERFANVRLFRQHDWFAGAIFDDARYAWDGDEPLKRVEVHKVAGRPPGSELYTIALASDSRVTAPPSVAVLTGTAELRELAQGFERLEERRRELAASEEERREEVAAFEDERLELLRHVARLEGDRDTAREDQRSLRQRVVELETEITNVREQSLHIAREAEDARAEAAKYEELQVAAEAAYAELAALRDEVRRSHELIRQMRSTRVWRLGERLWRLKSALRGRPVEDR
jgi:SAM-dependent methyltransferase